LTVIDMQERLVPSVSDPAYLIDRCERLIKGCRLFDIPILYTQQYTKGLGPTVKRIVDAGTSAIDSFNSNVKSAGEDPILRRQPQSFAFVEKTRFSVYGEPEFEKALQVSGKEEILLCGIEAHVCVQQSALDLVDAGFCVGVVRDAVSSRHRDDAEAAYARMAAAGVTITTMESVLFELLGDAKHPAFKEISAVVK
jgi:nicotinamidase-related amidase